MPNAQRRRETATKIAAKDARMSTKALFTQLALATAPDMLDRLDAYYDTLDEIDAQVDAGEPVSTTEELAQLQYGVSIVELVYEALVEELLARVAAGEEIMLTGLGKFYHQTRSKPASQFVSAEAVLNREHEYSVLKFASTVQFNTRLHQRIVDHEVSARQTVPS